MSSALRTRFEFCTLNRPADDPPVGYRFLADDLKRVGGNISERHAWRLGFEWSIWLNFTMKCKSGKKSGPLAHDDLGGPPSR
jgi:hypothetical protein